MAPNESTMRLTRALKAWGTPAFAEVLKSEIERLGSAQLPLQQGLSSTGYALDRDVRARILAISEHPGSIRAKAGIFYAGIVPGCSCADDPTPVEEQPEYCVVQLDIDKRTAETTVTLVSE